MLKTKTIEYFEKEMKTKVVFTEVMDGLSNFVFKLTDEMNHQYIFKVLVSDLSDPFKKNERNCLEHIFKIYDRPVFENELYRIEHCIPSNNPQFSTVLEEPQQLLILRSIAQFNKLKKIQKKEPNFFFMMENSEAEINQKIYSNLLKLNESKRSEVDLKIKKISNLGKQLKGLFKFDELVLAHNDLFYRNIIFDTCKKVYKLIDFEYVGYNPLGMDVFQFINEFLIDYSIPVKPYFALTFERYPCEEMIYKMVHYYLFYYKFGDLLKDMEDNYETLHYIENLKEFQSINPEEIMNIIKLFPYFGILTNIFWFYWGLYLFEIDGIKLDYTEFALVKYDMIERFVHQLDIAEVSEAFFNDN